MHDPAFLAATVRRPFPKITRRAQPYVRARGEWYESLSPLAKLRHNARSPFWRFGRVELYWPSLIDVWHEEPDGADMGDVCKHADRRGREWAWLWEHRAHCRVNVIPWRTFLRWRYSRCASCGGRFRWGEALTSHQWDGAGPSRKGETGVFHGRCSAIVSYQRTLEVERATIVELFHAMRVAADLSEEELIAKLYVRPHAPGKFTDNHRFTSSITRALGWEFDHDASVGDADTYRLRNADGRHLEPYELARERGWRA